MDITSVEARRSISEEILKKTSDVQAIVERIHAVRFDTTRDVHDIERTIRNLVQEMKRLEGDLIALRKTQLAELENVLKLDQIGLPSHFISASKLTQSGAHLVIPQRTATAKIPAPSAATTEDDTMTEQEMANLKLMRTESTSTLEGQTPQNKWKSLFKMFQEWKRETNIAQGQYMLGTRADTSLEEEITKVRAAIVSLQHKKTLPTSEQELLSSLQHRLQQLLKAQKTLANASS